jgi:hypothetical protein
LNSPQPGVLDIATESWGILDVISPKPGTSMQPKRLRRLEIVILGTGDRIMFVQRAKEALAKMGIQLEVQDTVLPSVDMTDSRKMQPVCSICYKRKGEVLRPLY